MCHSRQLPGFIEVLDDRIASGETIQEWDPVVFQESNDFDRNVVVFLPKGPPQVSLRGTQQSKPLSNIAGSNLYKLGSLMVFPGISILHFMEIDAIDPGFDREPLAISVFLKCYCMD
jgi:hypothetical protein